jgi:hypothetical protein
MSLIIGVDFDGTCVDNKFPQVGRDVPHAVKYGFGPHLEQYLRPEEEG